MEFNMKNIMFLSRRGKAGGEMKKNDGWNINRLLLESISPATSAQRQIN